MLIRPERVTDYPGIATVHTRAFSAQRGVPLIVTLQRQRREFDPELSLLAEVDGRLAGHILFSPYQMRLLDQTIPSVNLSPLGIDPAYQRQGIGGRLIAEGHAIAAAKGYLVSTVLGHPTYYPKFGYQTHAFGSTQLTLPSDPAARPILETRSPTEEDIPALHALWFRQEHHVDIALDPGHELLDWLSPDPAIQATVYIRDAHLVGYTRIHRNEPTSPRYFLAHDAQTARAMLTTLASQRTETAVEPTYTLPLHPFSATTAALGPAQARSWEAGMAYELAPSPLPDYLAALSEKGRPAGRPIWPVAFDLA